MTIPDNLFIEGNQYQKVKPAGSLPTDVYRVRKWGEPIMVKEGGFSVTNIGTSNFQAVKLYNKATNQMGGVSNYLQIPQSDIKRLAALQVEDEFVEKKPGWNNSYSMEAWRVQKMSWLCKPRGTIYFTWDMPGDWTSVLHIRWGTIALGNVFVTVDGIETLIVKTPDGVRRSRKMARLTGFRRSDWGRPLEELVAHGLVHRCYCAYLDDDSIGDTPKGIVYSPFWSPQDWLFIGTSQIQPAAFYIPRDWLNEE